jgi:hypothetical protein
MPAFDRRGGWKPALRFEALRRRKAAPYTGAHRH